MPYVIERLPDGKYCVKNRITGKIHAFHTTLDKAKDQIRVMELVDHEKKAPSIEKSKPKKKEEKPKTIFYG